MPSANSLLAMAAAVSTASAAFQGFNYGNVFTNGAAKTQTDFENEFTTAASLEGTDGSFTSARLYTMVQAGTANEPISAIPAAIKTKTSLLLGLWASAGQDAFNNEIAALKNTADQYCGQIDDLIAGISVGSEDLYRISPTGIAAGENPGANPDTLVTYIGEVRKAIEGTCLSGVPIGHVDTWTAFANTSNNALTEACDWLGMDAYPYFEDTKHNPIEEGANLFQAAWDQVRAVAGGREIWITETGWPVSGKTFGEAVPSTENARTFWKDVGCPMFGVTNVWWYTFQDSAPTTPNPSFGVIGSELTTKPLYDLSCDASDSDDDKTSTKATDTGKGGSATKTGGSGSASASASASDHASATTHSGPISTGTGSGSGSGYNSTATWSGRISRTTVVPTVSPTGGSGSGSGSGSGDDSGSGSGSGSGDDSGSGSGSDSGSGSGSDSGSGSGSGSGDSSTPTDSPNPVEAGGSQLNSIGAAAVALLLAVAFI